VTITVKLLQSVGTNTENAKLYAPLLEVARVVKGDEYQTITSKAGKAMLVAQLAFESMYFTRTSEVLNYSVKALREGNRVKYFTADQARAFGYVRTTKGEYLQKANDEAIANLYYGTRNGNRGVGSGDGYLFRGGGLIQLTGRKNYEAFAASIGQSAEDVVDYVRTPEGAVASALWYWRANNLLTPASRGDVTYCTKIITGGDHGLLERTSLYSKALAALG
jgi:putative chitinase